MAEEAAIIGRWISKLDERVDELFLSVGADDLYRANRAADSLRSWLTMLELMVMETTSQALDAEAYERFAVRLALVDARLKSLQWLIDHRRKPWYIRLLPWIGRIAEFVLDRLGFGPLLPRLPRGR